MRRHQKRSEEWRQRANVQTLLIEPEAPAAIQMIALHDSWLALASEQFCYKMVQMSEGHWVKIRQNTIFLLFRQMDSG